MTSRVTTPMAISFVALALLLGVPGTASAATVNVSTDPYTNTSSYHATQVEAESASFGNAIVSVFQSGRFRDGGSSNLGWATSLDGGHSWQHGFLPSTTIYASPAGPYQRITDPAVTTDAKHSQVLIVGLASDAVSGFTGKAVLLSRSSDGINWAAPTTVVTSTPPSNFDSTWIGCDNFASSPTYGTCYVEFDDFGHGNQMHIGRSTDGGVTWTGSQVPPGSSVLHGQPMVQPNGHVVVPIANGFVTTIESFGSTDGGLSFAPFSISRIQQHIPAGGIRAIDGPTADEDASGKVFVVWYDCRFRTGCTSNDLVMSTSTDGKAWTPVVRIPIDAVSSTVDHFLPGVSVRPGTSGSSASLALAYYSYPTANCSSTTCQLNYGMTTSLDGGATWSAGQRLAGPFTLTWLPSTTQGYMVGDYSNTSWPGPRPETVFAVASAGTCQLGSVTSCHESMAAIARASLAGPFTRATSSGALASAPVFDTSLRSMH